MEYRAVLFDFDYTLGDATTAIVAGFQHAFGQMGLPIPEREAIRLTIGYMLEDAFVMLSGDNRAESRTEFHRLYLEKAIPMQTGVTVLFPGASELLHALHDGGIPVGVVSSKRGWAVEEALEKFSLLSLLHLVTGGDGVTYPKPHPEGILAAVAKLGLTPAQVLYCGDTVLDAEAAQRAGTHFCAVLNGTTKAEAFSPFPCDYIATDLMALRQWLGL